MRQRFLFLFALAAPTLLVAQSAPAATRFAPGVIETDADEYGLVFSPDGQSVYFVRRQDRRGRESIMVSRRSRDGWSVPAVAGFSGRYYDKEPFVAPDGRRLFFTSTRPNSAGGDDDAFDIWMTERTGDAWGEPVRLPSTVNSSTYDNYPSVAANGNLYFASRREGGQGRLDLYVSRYTNGEYQPAERIDVLNSTATDADPFIAPDESYIIFSSGRSGFGSGDLFVAFRDDGGWTEPVNLGSLVNTEEFEYTAFVRDAQLFFSRGWGEIYFIDISALEVFDR